MTAVALLIIMFAGVIGGVLLIGDENKGKVRNRNGYRKRALMATKGSSLTHSLGKNDPSHTILTEKEFCSQLERLRDRL